MVQGHVDVGGLDSGASVTDDLVNGATLLFQLLANQLQLLDVDLVLGDPSLVPKRIKNRLVYYFFIMLSFG